MALHAIDDLEDAFAATRAFLLPFDAGRWLRLAAVAFFLGGVGSGVPTSGFQFGGDPVDTGGPVGPGADATLPAVPGEVLALALVVGAVLLLFGLALGFVGSVMEFVLVASLREEDVRVRRYVSEHWRAGARLFGFRIVLSLLAAALVVLPVLALLFATGGPAAVEGPGSVVGLALLAVPLAVLVGLALSLVGGFTTFFVVPVMLLEGRGVLAGWRRFYGALRAEPREYLAFAVVTLVLTLVLGTAVGAVIGVLAVVVLGPLAIVGFAGALSVAALDPGAIGPAALPALLGIAVVALAAFLLVLCLAAVVRVPVVTYLRYYALFLLGDTDRELDLVPERRRAVRAGSGGGPSGEGSGTESA
jgi:hypothetical protein